MKKIPFILVFISVLILCSCDNKNKECLTCRDEDGDDICDVCGSKTAYQYSEYIESLVDFYNSVNESPNLESKKINSYIKYEVTGEYIEVKDNYVWVKNDNNNSYEMIDIIKNKKIWSYTATSSEKVQIYATSTFEINLHNDIFIVVSTVNNDKKILVYDLNGNLKFKTSCNIDQYYAISFAPFNFIGTYAILGDKLFSYDQDFKFKEICNIREQGLDKLETNHKFYFVNNKLIAYNNSKVITFDEEFNVDKSITIPTFSNYNNQTTEQFILLNGNVYTRIVTKTPIDNSVSGVKYDYYYNGKAITVKSFLTNIETSETILIDNPSLAEFSINNLPYSKDFGNIILGYKIINGDVSDEVEMYTLTNEGVVDKQIKNFPNEILPNDKNFDSYKFVLNNVSEKMLNGNTFIYNFGKTEVYKNDELIGYVTGKYIDSNDKYIITDNGVYTQELIKKFEIPVGYTLYDLTEDTLVLRENVDNKYYRYYVYDGNELIQISGNNSLTNPNNHRVYVFAKNIYVENDDDSICLYNNDGSLVKSILNMKSIGAASYSSSLIRLCEKIKIDSEQYKYVIHIFYVK